MVEVSNISVTHSVAASCVGLLRGLCRFWEGMWRFDEEERLEPLLILTRVTSNLLASVSHSSKKEAMINFYHKIY
jgi:hypothetical protein